MARWERYSKAEMIEKYRLIGESEAFIDCMQQISRLAVFNRPILIIGERGTGKELVAARLHYLSPRWEGPRIALNCAAFAENLLESELFGYEPGAFTGAQRLKPGRFELAHGGTLFLDELAQSPLPMQEKLLRVLEYQEFERVGGTDTLQVDVRVIAATNQDLPSLCEKGKFKRDLLDRLSFEVITIPPLRARIEDIPMLAGFFSRRMAVELDFARPPLFSKHAMEQLMTYAWPGNIRELKNVVERATSRTEGEPIIEEIDFDPFESPFRPLSEPERKGKVAENQPKHRDHSPHNKLIEARKDDNLNLKDAIAEMERGFIQQALEIYQFHLGHTADKLGISYHQLRRLMKKHGLSRLGQE